MHIIKQKQSTTTNFMGGIRQNKLMSSMSDVLYLLNHMFGNFSYVRSYKVSIYIIYKATGMMIYLQDVTTSSNKHPLNMRNIIEENLTYGHVNEFIKEIKTMLKRIIIIHYVINTGF